MKNLLVSITPVVLLCLIATTAFGQDTVSYTLNETAPGSWDLLVDVTGTTAGLSAYEVWVDGVAPGSTDFTENGLYVAVPFQCRIFAWNFP